MNIDEIKAAREKIADYEKIWWGEIPIPGIGAFLNAASSGWPKALDRVEELERIVELFVENINNCVKEIERLRVEKSQIPVMVAKHQRELIQLRALAEAVEQNWNSDTDDDIRNALKAWRDGQ